MNKRGYQSGRPASRRLDHEPGLDAVATISHVTLRIWDMDAQRVIIWMIVASLIKDELRSDAEMTDAEQTSRTSNRIGRGSETIHMRL